MMMDRWMDDIMDIWKIKTFHFHSMEMKQANGKWGKCRVSNLYSSLAPLPCPLPAPFGQTGPGLLHLAGDLHIWHSQEGSDGTEQTDRWR